MTTWTMWNTKTQSQLSETEFTEEAARQILHNEASGTMFARNAAGDEITKHDGPIHVARVTTNDLEN